MTSRRINTQLDQKNESTFWKHLRWSQREFVVMINSLRRLCTMCQAEKMWKGSKITASVSVRSWQILGRRKIYASPVGMVCPKGTRKCWFPAGQVPATLPRSGIMPKHKQLVQGCKLKGGKLGMEIPTRHSEEECVLVLYSSSPSSSCSFSFSLPDTITSSLRLISHTSKQSPAPNEFSFSISSGSCAWKCLNFLSVWVLPENFFHFFFSTLIIKTAWWFFVKRQLSRFSADEQ